MNDRQRRTISDDGILTPAGDFSRRKGMMRDQLVLG
jgi:hypothetical protein